MINFTKNTSDPLFTQYTLEVCHNNVVIYLKSFAIEKTVSDDKADEIAKLHLLKDFAYNGTVECWTELAKIIPLYEEE